MKKASIKEGQRDKSKITSRLHGQSWLNIEGEEYTELTDRMSETPAPINREVRHRTGRELNMRVRDLYTYSNDEQTFILFMEGYTEPCFKGSLEDWPSELMYMLVDKFRAIDFNTIEVILIG